jgi:hypothetical protein
MLDELDALMERMLALPVNELEEEPKAPAPPLAATLTVVEPPAPAPEPSRPPLQPPHRIPVPDFTPAAEPPPAVLMGRVSAPPLFRQEIGNAAQTPAELSEPKPPPIIVPESRRTVPKPFWSEPVPAPDEILPPLVIKPPEPVQKLVRRRSLGSVLLHPVLWLNQAFDRCTKMLGGPGRWLRSSRGRMFLGYLGLALLALAALWCVYDWMGWTWMKDALE